MKSQLRRRKFRMKNQLRRLNPDFVSSIVILSGAITLIAVENTLIEILGVPSPLISAFVGLAGIVSGLTFGWYLLYAIHIQRKTQFLPLACLIYLSLAFILIYLFVITSASRLDL